ncbi:hypothetical protein BT69DRAFT_1281981 [Atractiella rhizophila]|nr:hypothetical protein BT69DRAFT_1281981 [Atractiella rhizophila]
MVRPHLHLPFPYTSFRCRRLTRTLFYAPNRTISLRALVTKFSSVSETSGFHQ